MAYQPKNYKKFVATAATATLVATAIVPAAFADQASTSAFTDVGDRYEEAVEYVVSNNISNGLTATKFGVGASITRGDAAIMIAKATGIMDETAPNSGFSDVPKRGAVAVNSLKEAGIINGVSKSKFGWDQEITRGQAAYMLAVAYELEDGDASELDFSDVGENHRFAKEVAALVENKITNGQTKTKFGIESSIKRGDFAVFLHRLYELEIGAPDTEAPELELDGSSKITVENGAKLVLPKVTATDNVDEDIEIERRYFDTKGTVDNSDDKEIDGIDTTKAGTYQVFYSAEDAAGNVSEDLIVTVVVKEAAAAAPAVQSVSAINATQVKVNFNTAVDKEAAETPGNVTIQGVEFSSRTLSEDGKTLTLVAKAPINVENATVVVEPIKTKADAKVETEKFISLITYKDLVAPVVSGVEAKTNGSTASTVTVTVSEPVKTGALVKINGAYANVDFAGTNKATISGQALETGKTHTIELINLEDLAGNKTVTTSANFTVSVDTTAPTATLTSRGDKEILVTFNEPVTASTVQTALANGAVKNEALADVKTGTVSVVDGTNNTQFVIPVSDVLYADKNSRTLTVVLSDVITDELGNKLVPTTQKVTLTKDTVKPVTTGYTVTKAADGKVTAIEVNFSEGLKAAAAGEVTAPTIVNENGVAVTDFLGGLKSAAVIAGDKKVVFTATTPAEVTGKYAFSFANELVSDQAETANKSTAFNYTIDFGKGESVTTFDLTSATATKNVVTVTFPEAVKGGAVANSATDLSNYTLAGKPLPTGTTITLDADQKIATITLPAESVAKTDQAAIFTVANIKNTAGTKTVKTYTGTLSVTDNVSPTVQSARILDNKTVELTYNENIALTGTTALVGDEFTITQGSTALTLADADLTASAVSGFPTKVRVSLTTATLDLTQTITVSTKTPAIADVEDIQGNNQKVGVQLTVVK